MKTREIAYGGLSIALLAVSYTHLFPDGKFKRFIRMGKKFTRSKIKQIWHQSGAIYLI